MTRSAVAARHIVLVIVALSLLGAILAIGPPASSGTTWIDEEFESSSWEDGANHAHRHKHKPPGLPQQAQNPSTTNPVE